MALTTASHATGQLRGAEWLLGPTWAFGQETAVHALRLMGSGVFESRHMPCALAYFSVSATRAGSTRPQTRCSRYSPAMPS